MEENPVKPVTVDEAVDWLLWYLEAEDIAAIAAQDEDELLDQHFDTCLLIRNAFSLWGNPALLAAAGADNPDEASLVILRALWRRLNPLH